ncbi:MAG: 50S ribosomal protein L29 [Lachnospiraceae bacterium]|nr:50S ribosomal protein L29 [Lachnospiraceae bacterium]
MKQKQFQNEKKNKSVDQLTLDLTALKKELFDLRLKNATNQLENTSKIREVRKNIARVQTCITQKQKLG